MLPQTEPEKRKWLKPVKMGKRSSSISEQKAMATIILLLQENHFALDTSVQQLSQSSQHDTGHAKLYGKGQGDLLKVLQKIDKENISIFVE